MEKKLEEDLRQKIKDTNKAMEDVILPTNQKPDLPAEESAILRQVNAEMKFQADKQKPGYRKIYEEETGDSSIFADNNAYVYIEWLEQRLTLAEQKLKNAERDIKLFKEDISFYIIVNNNLAKKINELEGR